MALFKDNQVQQLKDYSNFERLEKLIQDLNDTNSTNDKIEKLSKYKDDTFVKNILFYTYTDFKQYHVTSANLKKRADLIKSMCSYDNIFELLEDLSKEKISGHNAISEVNAYINLYKDFDDILYKVFDRNLETRMTTKLINKAIPNLIPTFEVQLAEKYDEKREKKIDFKKETWYASQKLDGCLNGETLIEFNDGKKIKIREIVNKKIKGKVKCYNVKDGRIEFKDIQNWMKNLSDINEDNDIWYELILENDKILVLTGNHRIWLPLLNCWRRVDELNGDETFLIN